MAVGVLKVGLAIGVFERYLFTMAVFYLAYSKGLIP
jgi:hypothetical protein